MFSGVTPLRPRRRSSAAIRPHRQALATPPVSVPRPSPPHGRLCVPSLLPGRSLRSLLAFVVLLVGGAVPAAAIGVDVTPLSGLVTSESGGQATFTVVL